MSRGPALFKQRDVAAAVRACQKAGLHVREVKITSEGAIVLSTDTDDRAAPAKNPWDKYYENPPDLRKKL